MRQFFAVLILILFTLGLMYFMLSGWQRRGKKIPIDSLPELPDGDWRAGPATSGIYVSSTLAGMRFERVVSQGLGVKAAAQVYVLAEGVVILREGASDLFIPISAMKEVGLTSGMVGKFAGPDSILVIRWRAGQVPLDTGIHIRSQEQRQELLARISALFTPANDPRNTSTEAEGEEPE